MHLFPQRTRRVAQQLTALLLVRQDHAKTNPGEVFANGRQCRSKIGIAGDQYHLLNLQLIGLTGHAVHTQGDIYVSFFFFKLPNRNLIPA